MRRILNFISGMMLGTLFGAALGLLLAPDSGSGLRRRVRDEFDTILAESRAAAQTRQDELMAQFDELTR